MSFDSEETFTTFITLVTIDEADVQNVQEMSRIGGQIREEFDAIGADLRDVYAALGRFDFVVIFDAESSDDAFQAALALERHGLSGETMEVAPIEQFGELVEDV